MSRKYDSQPHRIKDAIASLGKKVNLVGVVTETGLPRKTRGTDCYVSLRIVDPSRLRPSLPVNFFLETMDLLPQVMTGGEIILLSHVMMQTHKSDVYACFNKKYSSFALYEGKDSTSVTPYQCSANFHAREKDKEIILGMRNWLAAVAGLKIDAGSTDLLKLKELKECASFNLVCKVLHACETEKDRWMFFVWDGIDTPPVPIKTKLEDEKENSLPLQLEPIPLSRDVLCTFPPVGTVLRVTVDSGDVKLGLNYIKTGRWVKLLDLRCEVRSSLWCAVLMPFTKLCYLPDDNDLILQHQRCYDERLSSRWGHMPQTCFPSHSGMTVTSCDPSVPFISLMNVLTYPEVTYKFRCVVRVVAALPWRVSDFRSPSNVYRIRLTLEDPTARIHAFLYGEDAEEFFARFPSTDLLERGWNSLLGVVVPTIDDSSAVGDASRNPPWIDCCLKSYYIEKNDVWGTRNYRIFGTTLLQRP